jgi:hypothetical protein
MLKSFSVAMELVAHKFLPIRNGNRDDGARLQSCWTTENLTHSLPCNVQYGLID